MSSQTPSSLAMADVNCNCQSVDACRSNSTAVAQPDKETPQATDTVDALGVPADTNDGILSRLNPFKKKQQATGTNKDDLVSLEMCNKNNTTTCHNANSSQTNQTTHSMSQMKIHKDDNEYDFSHAERGYAVLIVNEDFSNDPDSKRGGAQEDLKKMKYIAKKLGFKVFNEGNELNLNKKKTCKILRDVQQCDHSNFDCFTLMISTHGMEVQNARANGRLEHALECADNQLVFTSTILAMFNDESCPSLKDKPKLFFIQACRGDNVDDGCEQRVSYMGMQSEIAEEPPPDLVHENCPVPDDELCEPHPLATPPVSDNDTTHEDTGEQADSKPAIVQNFIRLFKKDTPAEAPSLRPDTDQLVLYAIPERQYAWRSTIQGSWMLHYLHAVLEDHDLSAPRRLPALLTTVLALMAMRETSTDDVSTHKKKAVPVIEHKLTRDVVFREK